MEGEEVIHLQLRVQRRAERVSVICARYQTVVFLLRIVEPKPRSILPSSGDAAHARGYSAGDVS